MIAGYEVSGASSVDESADQDLGLGQGGQDRDSRKLPEPAIRLSNRLKK